MNKLFLSTVLSFLALSFFMPLSFAEDHRVAQMPSMAVGRQRVEPPEVPRWPEMPVVTIMDDHMREVLKQAGFGATIPYEQFTAFFRLPKYQAYVAKLTAEEVAVTFINYNLSYIANQCRAK